MPRPDIRGLLLPTSSPSSITLSYLETRNLLQPPRLVVFLDTSRHPLSLLQHLPVRRCIAKSTLVSEGETLLLFWAHPPSLRSVPDRPVAMFGRHTTLALCALGLLAQPFVQGQQTGQIIPTTLPACAQTCPILQQALQSCQANPQAAASCFCQSGLLQPIRTAGTNICNTVCQAADWTTISNWFKQYCANPANPGQGQAGGQTTTTATKPTKTTATTTAPTDQAAATSSDASYLGSDDINRPESGSQW